MKRLLCALLCAALLLPLVGCGGAKLNSFTWFVDAIPTNLDPQIAAESADVIACTNLYSGLFRLDADSHLQNAGCESYTVSSDGLTYTFQLKSGLTYRSLKGAQSAYTVTAADYVFAFQRVFTADTASPYADTFAGIRNAQAVLSGQSEPSALGVTASGADTLIIQLSAADDHFLQKLTLPGAMPCCEAFFNSTAGTYGLNKDSVLANGSFYLYNWTESGLFLRRDTTDASINSIRLVQNTTNSTMSNEELVKSEKCTAALDNGSGDTTLTSIPYTDTTWCLVFNGGSVFANASLRQALAADVPGAGLPADDTLYSAATGILPSGCEVDSYDYRALAGDILAPSGDGAAAYAQALNEVGVDALKGISVLVPESVDSAYVQALNGQWQKDYSLFFNIESADEETFAKRIADGDFTLALVPLQLTQQDPLTLLTQFDGGWSDYYNASYHQLLTQAQTASGEAKVEALAQAERLLTEDCAAVPLYAQNRRLLVASGISGLRFDPYGPILDLTDATMKSS